MCTKTRSVNKTINFVAILIVLSVILVGCSGDADATHTTSEYDEYDESNYAVDEYNYQAYENENEHLANNVYPSSSYESIPETDTPSVQLSDVGFGSENIDRFGVRSDVYHNTNDDIYENDIDGGITAIDKVFDNWQEAYATLLREYMGLPVDSSGTEKAGWYFSLHDIGQAEVPKLFLSEIFFSGHLRYYSIYSFSDGEIISLELHPWWTIASEGGVFAIPGTPWIVLNLMAGSSYFYHKMVLENHSMVLVASGSMHLTQAGHDATFTAWIMDNWYEWYDFYLFDDTTRELVAVEEFEEVFGARSEWIWLKRFRITETNIQKVIYSDVFGD